MAGILDPLNIDLESARSWVEKRLEELLPSPGSCPDSLQKAMGYAVLGGGKRLRPILSMAVASDVCGDPLKALDMGCAAELVHCFSLVHDDLPSIDNDNIRRGRPTVHVKFGESTAILAGDALFALAFAVASDCPNCLKSLAIASGCLGLVGGEVMDVESEGGEQDIALVESIHRKKTGALVSSACEMGALAAGSAPEAAAEYGKFGMELGLAFQIVDDVLNVTGEPQKLGKSSGTDSAKRKLTYPAVIGVQESRDLAKDILQSAIVNLRCGLGLASKADEMSVEMVAKGFVEREF